MATKCTICYAWHPKEWDGSKGHWADTVAQCEIKGKFTTAQESCPDGKIVRPPINTKVTKSRPVAVVNTKTVAQNKPAITGELYAHQVQAFEQYKDSTEIPLFMEMGCVDCDTEYFNGFGWKRIADYTEGDKVLQWNEADESASLVKPTRYIKLQADKLVWFKTIRGMDQMLSFEHRLVNVKRKSMHYKRNPDITVRELLETGAGQNYLCPIAFLGYEYDPSLWELDEWQTRLMIAVIAEGHFAGTKRCYINFKKDYKIERLDILLEKCGIEYNKRICDDGYTRYSFIAPQKWKAFGPEWFNCPTEWVTSEVLLWDGDIARGVYRTTIKQSADFVQFKFASLGLRTSISVSDRRVDNKGFLYRVLISDQDHFTTWYSNSENQPELVTAHDGYKYCFNVPSSYLILRRNGGIFVTGNCGKSAVVLRVAGYKYKKGDINALLVVAPNDVHVQWAHEQIPLWLDCPYDIQCLFGRGGQKVAYPFDNNSDFMQVVCVNIDTFSTPEKWKDIVEWALTRKLFLVLDEGTVIKNVSSQRTQRMLYAFNDVVRRNKTILKSSVKTVARAILTGTPVTNGPMDLWAIMEFLRPNFFGRNWYSFQAHYGMFTTISVDDRVIKVPLSRDWWEAIKAINEFGEANAISGCSEDTFNTIHSQDFYEGPYKHADELKAILAPVAFFKKLKDCVDMPEEIRTVRELRMSPAIEKCYDDMIANLIATYEEHTMTAKNAMTSLIRLQQISSGFLCDKKFGENEEDGEEENEVDDRVSRLYGLIDDEDILPNEIQWIGNSNPKLDALYRDIDEIDKPLVIITRFTAEADRIYNDLCHKYATCLMTGWKRIGTIEEFKDGKYDIMVANGSVVSRGFNLQNSHTILFYSNTFSLETRLQTEGRIFRIGQKNVCEYIDYCYIMDSGFTIDEKITTALSLKRNLLDFIRGADIKELVQ